MTTPTLLTIKQVAAALGLSTAACYRRHYRGQLPAPVRLGQRSLRWREDDINAMLAAMLAPALPAIMNTWLEYARAQIIAGRTTPTTENEEMTK